MAEVASTVVASVDTTARNDWHAAVRSGGANVYAAIVSFAILILTARLLGPARRGEYAAATALVTLFSTIGSLSLGQVMLHHATGRQRAEWSEQVFGTLLGLLGLATALSWVTAAALYSASHGRLFGETPVTIFAMAFVALPFMMWFDQGRYLLFALDRVAAFNISQFVGYSVSVATLLALTLLFHLGLAGAILAWVTLYVALAIAGFAAARREIRQPRFDSTLARRALKGSLGLHWSTLSTFVHLQSSVLILNYFSTSAEVGYYQLATQVVSLGSIIPTGISSVAYGLTSTYGPDAAWGKQRKLVAAMLLGALMMTGVGYVLAPLGVRLLAGPDFEPAVPLIRVLLFALIGMTLAISMASQWVGRGLFRLNAILSIASALLSLVLDFALIPRYGMYGALTSTLAVYSVGLVANGVFALRIERNWRWMSRARAER